MALKTTYQDDVYTGNRKYNMTSNGDGTVSLVDQTEYTQVGDTFSSTDINAQNTAINLNTEKNRSTSFTLAAASWGTAETVNSRTVYTQTISVTEISEPHPEWGLLSATGAIPSEAEEEAFGTLVALTVDSDLNVMKVYASEVPTIDIVICVKGVK